MVSAILLDWDGTLVDSHAAILAAYHETSTDILGYPFPVDAEDVDRLIQLRGKDAFQIVCDSDEELVSRYADRFAEAYARTGTEAPVFPGAVETLKSLAAEGIRLGVVTSKARRRLEPDADRIGLAPYLALTVTGDDVEHAKPHPEGIVRAAEELGLPKDEILYVGDGPNDVIAAREAGVRPVAVTFGFHPEAALAAAPELVVENYAELAAHVRRENAAGRPSG